MVLTMLWIGFTAWRAAGGRERELYAVLLGVSLAFAVGVAYDWFWQLALSARLLHGDRDAGRGPLRTALAGPRRGPAREGVAVETNQESRRFGLTVAGLAIAWLSMLALIGPLLVTTSSNPRTTPTPPATPPTRSNTRTRRARSSPGRRAPTSSSACSPQAKGEYGQAIERYDQAIYRENNNWALYYRGQAEHLAGQNEAAQADLAEAKHLNPLETCLAEGFEGCG